MNHITAKKMQELNEQNLANIKALFAADKLIAEYDEFAQRHNLKVVICMQSYGFDIWAQGDANEICNTANATGNEIGKSPVHIIDEFTVVNTGA